VLLLCCVLSAGCDSLCAALALSAFVLTAIPIASLNARIRRNTAFRQLLCVKSLDCLSSGVSDIRAIKRPMNRRLGGSHRVGDRALRVAKFHQSLNHLFDFHRLYTYAHSH